MNTQGCILQHELFPRHIPLMLPEKSSQWCECKTKTGEMVSCVLTCWDMLMTLAALEGKLEKGTDSLLSLVRALQDRAPRTALLCARVSRSSGSLLAFVGRTAVCTKTSGTRKDLKDSKKRNMLPHDPSFLPSTSSALGLSLTEEQDLTNGRIHGADLARKCSFFHSPTFVPLNSHMKSYCTALYTCIMENFLHDKNNHPN